MSPTAARAWAAALLLFAIAAARPVWGAAKFTINVLDDPGVGFNDDTPATPVGGNQGKTVGEQRMIVFQAAADAWGHILDSTVPITVDASFAPLECSGGGAVTGQAAPYSVSNYPGLPTDGTYVLALANKLVGRRLSASTPDIEAQFNGGLTECMGVDWYYGLDGKVGATESDLLSTILHELGHGLGFTNDIDEETGIPRRTSLMDFDSHVLDTSTGKHWPDMSDAERLASVRKAQQLAWDGERVHAVAAWALAKGLPRVEPSPALSGFSTVIGEANFGRCLADGDPLTGQLAPGTVSSSCSLSSGSFSGKIALILAPDGCGSISAAKVVQNGGGLAMLFAYDVPDTPPPRSLEYGPEKLALYDVDIPTLALTRADANLLRNAANTTVTLSADKNRLIGADKAGNPLLFASDPIQPGSTGAHWDPLVRPNLVLEPVETPVVTTDLVMERALLWDIGWTSPCGDGTLGDQEACDDGARNSDRTKDACRLDCTKPKCGDGVVDTGEECDPGLAGVGLAADTDCTAECRRKSPTTTGGTGAGGSGGRGGAGGSGAGGSGGSAGGGGKGGSDGSGGSGSGGASAGSGGHAGSGGGGEAGGGGSSTSTVRRGGSSGGCGCHTNPEGSATPVALLTLGLGLALCRRRTRRS